MTSISKSNFKPLNIILIVIMFGYMLTFVILSHLFSGNGIVGIVSYLHGDRFVEINNVKIELPIEFYAYQFPDDNDGLHISFGDYKGDSGYLRITGGSSQELEKNRKWWTEFFTGHDEYLNTGIKSVYKFNEETIFMSETVSPQFDLYLYDYMAYIPSRNAFISYLGPDAEREDFLQLMKTLLYNDKKGELKHITDLTGL